MLTVYASYTLWRTLDHRCVVQSVRRCVCQPVLSPVRTTRRYLVVLVLRKSLYTDPLLQRSVWGGPSKSVRIWGGPPQRPPHLRVNLVEPPYLRSKCSETTPYPNFYSRPPHIRTASRWTTPYPAISLLRIMKAHWPMAFPQACKACWRAECGPVAQGLPRPLSTAMRR